MPGKGKYRSRNKASRAGPRVRYRLLYSRVKETLKHLEEIARSMEELGAYVVDVSIKRGAASLFGKRKNANGKTVYTNHLVVNGKARIIHHGIHGVRGWENNKVQFKTRNGADTEFEEIGLKKTKHGLEPTHTKRSLKKAKRKKK